MTGIYVRVSTEEQAKKGYSLEEQRFECRRKAGPGEEIKEYVDDAVSGEFLDRPALAQLRADIEAGLITKVICLDPDRWSRKLMNQLIITEEVEKKAQLVFVNGEYKNTPEGILFYQMRGAISEFEKAKINERMSRGRRQKARKGRVVRDYRIYGYDYDSQSCMLAVNPYEAEIVKLIFRLFTCPEPVGGKEPDERFSGINGIAKFLTDMKVPTKRNAGVWHRQVVRQMLMNRAYIGEFYHNRWNTEGMLGNRYKKPKERISMKERPREEWILVPCPPVVDKEMFDYAQELLAESRRRWAGKSRRQYLLSGLVRCGICGNTMTGANYKYWGKEVPVYTDFKGTAGARNKGCSRRIRAELLDGEVWEAVLRWLNLQNKSRETQKEEERNVPFEAAQLELLSKRLEDIKKSRQKLVDFIAGDLGDLGGKNLQSFKHKLKALKDEEEELERKQQVLEEKLRDVKGASRRQDLRKDAVEYYLSKAPEEMSFEDKKQLIRLLVKEIRVFEEEVKVYGF